MISFGDNLLITLGLSVGLNLIIFLFAFFKKTDKLTDITYSLTFMLLVSYSFFINWDYLNSLGDSHFILRSILYCVVLLWALRLGSFLAYRIHAFKTDKRFDKMRNSFVKFGSFWLLQGVSVYIIIFPVIFYFLYLGDGEAVGELGSTYSWSEASLVGIFISLFGLVFETIGDQQKLMFKLRKSPSFIRSGLWKVSRHPNYFGEILVWVGLLVAILIDTLVNEFSLYILFLFVPGLYIPLLLNLVSGIPLLEIKTNKKYANNNDYLEYCKRTSILVPFIGKKNLYKGKFNSFK